MSVLSEPNRALIMADMGSIPLKALDKGDGTFIGPGSLNRLLDAARAEGTNPVPPSYEGSKSLGDVPAAFIELGRPQGDMPAFCDMHPDDVLFQNSGVMVTVGDVRVLQRILHATGAPRTDRLSQLMAAMPAKGGAQ